MAQNERELIESTNGRSLGEITVKVNVDVTEALTGLKAVQREAKKATQALRELEAVRNGE